MTEENKIILNNYISEIEKYLNEHIYSVRNIPLRTEIINAMKYSLSAGGKRIRPVLVLEFCRMCGGNVKKAFPVACALEMIHTFSLIHDDMPCMDNDDYRRGKLSCHKAFNEATALLAGDALQNEAYKIIADSDLDDKIKVKVIMELSYAVGIEGMIGGQEMDMKIHDINIDTDDIIQIYSMKTGALLKCACKIGCIVALADNEKINAALQYAQNLGLAFQIRDDILDIISTDEVFGKPIGSDEKNNKMTYVFKNGLEKSEETVKKLTQNALEALNNFPENSFLYNFTTDLEKRKK